MDGDEAQQSLDVLGSSGRQDEVAEPSQEVRSRTRTRSRDDSMGRIRQNAKFIMQNHPDQNDH